MLKKTFLTNLVLVGPRVSKVCVPPGPEVGVDVRGG